MFQKRSKKAIFGSLLAVVLTVALLVSLAVVFLPKKTVEAKATPEPTEWKGERDAFRILVAGSDATSGLCDVLMLVSIDRTTHEVFVLQIPRDTYAKYTDKSYRKMNGAYAELGGMSGVADFLSSALGVPIDRTLHLSPSAFRTIVDAMGGVEIDLPRDLHYEDPAQGLSIHLKAGKQTLNGAEAEQFVRYRAGYAQGDLDRLDAQKIFLSALFQKLSSLGSIEAARLAMKMRGEVDGNFDAADILSLSGELLKISPEKVFFVTAPGQAVTATQSGASYYALSAPAMAELLTKYFGAPEGSFDPEHVFLNEKYESFAKIYREKREYFLTPCS
ncbi:MAG: LCP family protein [Clostridia bacterium]|nr:LCP family protein [Clostridia bacterium]